MTNSFNARIEFATREDIDEQLLEEIQGYSLVVSRSDRGWVEAIFSLPAENLRQATATALAIAERATEHDILLLEVMPTQEFDLRVDLMDVPELVSVKQAAEMLEVTVQGVNRQIREGTLAAVRVGSFWAIQRASVASTARYRRLHPDEQQGTPEANATTS